MYDPSAVGKKGTIFGLPYSVEEASLIFVPVHLDVTTSYGAGTSEAPKLILEASTQLDLSLPSISSPWEMKMALSDTSIGEKGNKSYRKRAEEVIEHLEAGKPLGKVQPSIAHINQYCDQLHKEIRSKSQSLLEQGKWVAVVGGDHSSPLGLIQALSDRHPFGILQIDAHMDLRDAYEGFTYSHASIMFNALQCAGVTSLTQVGIRDYCEEEEAFLQTAEIPVHTFYDEQLFSNKIKGINWDKQCDKVISTLPELVYVSFDIDGLIPSLCPNTGTPVPGGLDFNEVNYLMEKVVRSGRKIIGFDVCEVGNQAWDANVGARVLFRLATLMGVSQGLLQFK